MLDAVLSGAASAIATGVIAGLVAWGGLKVELRYHRRDIDRAQSTADHAHDRIDDLRAQQ